MRKCLPIALMFCILSAGCSGRDLKGSGEKGNGPIPPVPPSQETRISRSDSADRPGTGPAASSPASKTGEADQIVPPAAEAGPLKTAEQGPAYPSPKSKGKPARDRDKAASLDRTKSVRSPTLMELRSKYSDTFLFRGRPGKKQVALTFDDAPDTVYTPQVLDILKRYHVKATFFVVGYRAAQHPGMVKRMIREGHVVGNHSYGHAYLKKLTRPEFIQEIEKAERILTPLTGYVPRLVRPPYGAVNDEQLSWLSGHGYLTVNWNVDPQDWMGLPSQEILSRSLSAAQPGSIILMHCGTGNGGSLKGTVGALPAMIEKLRGKGYQLVTLADLLQVEKEKQKNE